jgi:hypothetical protein
MRTRNRFINILSQISAIILVMLFAAGNLTIASGSVRPVNKQAALAVALQIDIGTKSTPLGIIGIVSGQTALINVYNSQDPGSELPPDPCRVELSFQDIEGNLLSDREGRPFQKIVTIDPRRGDFLKLPGDQVIGNLGRVTIIPCIKILKISGGTHVLPTFEMYNENERTSLLSPGTLKGFNPQPDPPKEFGIAGITRGQTARINVINMPDPNSSLPQNQCTVEMTFLDSNDKPFLDRSGHLVHKVVTLAPHQAAFLDLNADELSFTVEGRVTFIPCIRVREGTEGTLVGAGFEMIHNDNKKTVLQANFH